MAEPEVSLPEIYLRPGEMVLAREPTILATILGSCIGVTFWCARLRVGALCHSILPTYPRPSAGKIRDTTGYRYVDFCVRSLASQFNILGRAAKRNPGKDLWRRRCEFCRPCDRTSHGGKTELRNCDPSAG